MVGISDKRKIVPIFVKVGTYVEPQTTWDLSDVQDDWKPYMKQLELYLNSENVSVGEFYQGLLEYNANNPEDSENEDDYELQDLQETHESDFPNLLPITLYQHWLDLGDNPKTVDRQARALLNRDTLIGIWQYFCHTDPIAHRVLGHPSEIAQVLQIADMAYAGIYRKHFQYLFRTFLLSAHPCKQIMFIAINNNNRKHLLLRKTPESSYTVNLIDSHIGIDLGQQFNTNELLYTLFTAL